MLGMFTLLPIPFSTKQESAAPPFTVGHPPPVWYGACDSIPPVHEWPVGGKAIGSVFDNTVKVRSYGESD